MAKGNVLTKRPPKDRYQDLPVIALFRTNDRVEQFNAILREHDYGMFGRSAALVDEILTDPRIAGIVEQRAAGLMAAPLTFEPGTDKRKAKKVAEILGGSEKKKTRGKWRLILPQETLTALLTWAWFLGVAVAEIIWQRTADEWSPYLHVWHPQYLRWDWTIRRFVLLAAGGRQIVLPRPDEQPQGDGQWFVYCPFGVLYGWNRGLIRSLGLPYNSRTWNDRDWDRHNERQGMAILKAIVPSGGERKPKDDFFQQLSRVGSEAAVLCPQGAGGPAAGNSFDVQKIEFEARTWEAMDRRKAVIDTDIAIRLLGQNLTTEVQGGSRAASQTHDLVRLDKAIFDSEIGAAIRSQVLTHWANWNFGDPELAPWPTYHVRPPDDEQGEATVLSTMGDAVTKLKSAEARVDTIAILEAHGVPLLDEDEVEEKEPPAPDDGDKSDKAKDDDELTDGDDKQDDDDPAESEEEPAA